MADIWDVIKNAFKGPLDKDGDFSKLDITNDHFGARYARHAKSANKLGELSEEGVFSGSKSGKFSEASEIFKNYEGLKEYADLASEDFKGKTGFEKPLKKAERELSRNFEKLATDFGQLEQKHKLAQVSLRKGLVDAREKIQSEFNKAAKPLVAELTAAKEDGARKVIQDKLDVLRNRKEAILENIKGAYEAKLEYHESVIGHVDELIKDIEDVTNKSATEARKAAAARYAALTGETVESKIATTTENAGVKALENGEKAGFITRLFANLSGKHGTGMQVQSVGLGAVSAGLAYDAIKRATGSVSTSDVQNGEAQANPGNIPIAAVEAIGAGLTAMAAARTHH